MRKDQMIYERKDGLFDWRLRDGNGQIVSTSGDQGYETRTGAKRGLENAIEEFAKLIAEVGEEAVDD